MLLLSVCLVGCQPSLISLQPVSPGGAASAATGDERHGGPPPPGYVRILGNAVPGWQSTDAFHQRNSMLSWSLLGPQPITHEFWSGNDLATGRVVAVVPHPTDADTVYIAAASGGIWKTTNGGSSWLPLTDELANLNHGCLALDPANPQTIYAGTGEYTTASGGDGIFRSVDGGVTWSRFSTAAETGANCSAVIVDPQEPLTVHVSGSSGYARTSDGGTTWQLLLAGAASALTMDAGDPDTLFLGRQNAGIFRSRDGGDTWTQVFGGLPLTGVRRVLVQAAPADPGTLYAALMNTGNQLLGLFRSDDDGDTWIPKANTPNFAGSQGWYSAFLTVSPTDSDLLFAGGVFPTYAPAGAVRSSDGGNGWIDVTVGVLGGQLHPDMHAGAFAADGSIWIGCDGGVWKSNDNGQEWLNLNQSLAITQSYTIARAPGSGLLINGTQDNGTIEGNPVNPAWSQILAGDGGFATYDFDQPSRRYVTYIRLSVYRLDSGGSREITGPWGADNVSFIAPLVADPLDSDTLYGGTNRLWRTTNASATNPQWTPISNATVGAGQPLDAIAVAAADPATIWLGGAAGKVAITRDGGATWQDRSSGLPGGGISDLLVDPQDPQLAWVGLFSTSGPRLLLSNDAGLSWQNRTGSLPGGLSIKALAVDWRSPSNLYIGTGAGVYYSTNGGQTWTKDGSDLPNVNIGDLLIDFATEEIYAATFGRGTWRAPLLPIGGIFVDGFEAGNSSSWSSSQGD